MAKPSVAAYHTQKKITKKALTDAGFENIKISNGYYYFSGFATNPECDNVIYFSIMDTRMNDDRLLIRSAKDYKDFTGGTNQYCKLRLDEIKILAKRVTEPKFVIF